ncbi:hypothetical protein EV401DRAFT_1909609 [Pisolithus croceorrhizus]|nr:hypothetical protein EV401DRAFT_1909609 [Pisolithus croceorrhizus]
MTLFMAASLISPLTTFGHSLTCIGASLAHSAVLVASAILNFLITLVESVIQLGRSVGTLLVGLTQSILGFVVANFAAIAIIGGVYYVYMQRRQRGVTVSDTVKKVR